MGYFLNDIAVFLAMNIIYFLLFFIVSHIIALQYNTLFSFTFFHVSICALFST